MTDYKHQNAKELFSFLEAYLFRTKEDHGDELGRQDHAFRLPERLGEYATHYLGSALYVNGKRVLRGSHPLQRHVHVLTFSSHPNKEADVCVATYMARHGNERYRDLITVKWRPSGSQTIRSIRLGEGGAAVEGFEGDLFADAMGKEKVSDVVRQHRRSVVSAEDFPRVFASALYACVAKVFGGILLDAHGRELHDVPCHELPDFPLYYAANLCEAKDLFERSTIPVALLGI